MVLIGAVQQVRVEAQGIAGFHLDVDQVEPFENFPNTIGVRAGLLAGQNLIDATQLMRFPNDLQAAILLGGAVDYNVGAREAETGRHSGTNSRSLGATPTRRPLWRPS